jgi:hypothetical protein
METGTYESQLASFVASNLIDRPEFKHYFKYPCLSDDTVTTGFDTHYVYHVAWAVGKIFAAPPKVHYDISSSLYFCSTVASITPTIFIDYRPPALTVDNLICTAGDLTDNRQWLDNQFESLSCMHVVEHIGMGRYGEPLNTLGDIVAMSNLRRAIAPGGRLLFVVPVGRPSIFFNAHRVYSAGWIEKFFSTRLRLNEFYLIPGPTAVAPIRDCSLDAADNLEYACGCFEFINDA